MPEYLPNDLPFWFSMVERACRSRGIESLHLKREVLANRLPAAELLRCKDVMNAHFRTYDELTRALVAACAEANADMSVSCVILTGAGDVFCAGGNIKDMYARANHFAGNAAEIRRTYQAGVQTIARALYDLEVPSIAAVNGAAMGAGMDFATLCTMRIASERAKFAESFIKLGPYLRKVVPAVYRELNAS